jgi:photosystem II stability/assembly factor-like uncharacterized protein
MATFLWRRARFVGAFVLALAVLSGFPASASVGLRPIVNRQAYSNSTMTGVSCWSAAGCVAVGWYAGGNSKLGLVYRTTDGGTSWNRVSLSPTGDIDSVSCPSASHCVAVGEDSNNEGLGRAILTTDGGRRWTVTSMSLPGGDHFGATTVDCPSSSICFSGGGGGVAKSTDGGRTWKTEGINPQAYDTVMQVDCPTTSVCDAAANGHLLRTTNGGASWTQQLAPINAIYWGVSCPTASTCGVVTSSGTFLRTTDGGQKWTRHSVGLKQATIVSCASMSTCEVGGFTQASIWAVYETTNGGNTWTPDRLPVPPATDPNGNIQSLRGIQRYADGTCMMVGQYPGTTAAIFKTTDGVNWTSQPVPL